MLFKSKKSSTKSWASTTMKYFLLLILALTFIECKKDTIGESGNNPTKIDYPKQPIAPKLDISYTLLDSGYVRFWLLYARFKG